MATTRWPRPANMAPAGDLLRFAYVPPSLRILRQRRRSDRWRLLVRAALMGFMMLGATGNLFGAGHPLVWASSQRAAITSSATPPAGVDPSPSLAPSFVAAQPAASQEQADTTGETTHQLTEEEGGDAVPVAVKATFTALPTVAPPAVPTAATVATVRRALALSAVRTPTPKPAPPLDTAGLTAELQRLTKDAKGTYGISVIDLTTGQEVNLHALSAMPAASVNKLEVLAVLYYEVEHRKLSLEATIQTTADDIQDYGTGVIRYQPVGTSYTVDELARLLIEQSDNTASYILAQTIGLGNINALAKGWGLRSTEVGETVSSPHDAALLLALLYRGRLANAGDTREMLDFLEHTAWNDRIPAGVPAGTVVAHKIGNDINVVNDAGIVYLPGRPYVLSVFTQDVDEDEAMTIEPQLSAAVYAYELKAKEGH